jgi:hypothetical protein
MLNIKKNFFKFKKKARKGAFYIYLKITNPTSPRRSRDLNIYIYIYIEILETVIERIGMFICFEIFI